jgi:hypothetical protein
MPSASWATRFVQYVNTYFALGDPMMALVDRTPRAEAELRKAVSPRDIAFFYYKLEQELQKRPRAVRFVRLCAGS